MMGCINVELCIMLSTVSEILTVASYWVNIQIIIGIGWVWAFHQEWHYLDWGQWYLLKAEVDNIDQSLDDSWYHCKLNSLIIFILQFKSRTNKHSGCKKCKWSA